ncbi:hypothetical protein AOLI_G00105940 [Acnodon oligacanthus]
MQSRSRVKLRLEHWQERHVRHMLRPLQLDTGAARNESSFTELEHNASSADWHRQHRAGTCHIPLYLRRLSTQKAQGIWWHFGAILSAPPCSRPCFYEDMRTGNPVALVPHLQQRYYLPRPLLAWIKVHLE